MSLSMPLMPRVSEKAYDLSHSRNIYVFQVPSHANKTTVAAAITSQFKVTVADVNITNLKGKTTRRMRRGGRSTTGKRPDIKKAYVTLKTGDTIAIFASEEDKKSDKKAKEKK